MKGMSPFVLLLLCLCGGRPVLGARILAMLPYYARSHQRVYQPIMKTLAAAGHEVVVYSPFPLDEPFPNYTDVYMESTTIYGKINTIIDAHIDRPFYDCLDLIWDLALWQFEEFMEDKVIQKLLKSDEKFDLVISEALSSQEYTLVFGHVFKAPVIVMQTFLTNVLSNLQAGNALSVATMPDICFGATNKMNFVERAMNAFSIVRGLYFHYNWHYPKMEALMRPHFPDMPPLQEMLTNVSLYFVNDHLTADYAQPRTPNIIPVAGIAVAPEKPLPKDIEEFMEGASEGVIFFSLGSLVPDDMKPSEHFDLFVNVFKRLRQRVLWKTRKQHIQGLSDNVIIRDWVPQVDILAHPKCLLFITHGGLNSMNEAIKYGVPVVGIPQFFDQHRNVKLYVQTGTGVEVQARDLTEDSLLHAVQTVLRDPQYKENMQRLSRIFNDQPLTPAQSVVYWTEYVLRHGGAPHLRPAASRLPWYQRYLLDVLAGALLALAASVAALCLLARWLLALVPRAATTTDTTKKIN